jgi:predicted transposase YbfD/YdcC
MIDGAKGPTDFERFGKAKSKFLRKFLPLQNGIPSHDTFRRVLGKIDPRRFNAALVEWLKSVADVTGDIISIDGKLLRRALTKDCKMPCIVSAHSSRTKLVIGQVKADEKSNEITAIPALLDLLCLKGAIVTIDAAGCQKKIVRKILKRGAGYVISLKGNQSTMHDEIRAFMQDPAFRKKFKKAKTVDNGHGRVETRTCWQTEDIGWFEDKDKWAGLRSVCMAESVVYDKSTGKTASETRFFISSLPVDPKRALEAIRAHWGVEAMHWILDMDFDEQVAGKAGGPRGEPRHAQARRAERAAPRQVRLRRNQREAKGAHMGRRQAAEPHARGVEGRRNSQATDSNPRGLDARAFAKETGALENCAWNTS